MKEPARTLWERRFDELCRGVCFKNSRSVVVRRVQETELTALMQQSG